MDYFGHVNFFEVQLKNDYSIFQGERATGYGVAILNALFGKYSKSSLLSQAYENATKNAK